MKTLSILWLVGACLLLVSCATQNILTTETPSFKEKKIIDSLFTADTAYEYKIRKDDKINISVWNNDDLSVGSIFGIYNSNEVYGKWLLVDMAGNITVPKLGEVHVLGLTIREAKEQLRTNFSKWIVNPVVELKVLNKEVTLLGELKTPGKYQLEKERNTLLELIGKAGDFELYADKRKIQVVRIINNNPVTKIIDMTKMSNYADANLALYPGDIVYVPSRKGKVWDKRAGAVIVPVATAISAAVLLGKL